MSIIVNQLSYVHPDREILFENLSFHLNKGEKVALLGKNGTGKSTLLKIISGQLQPAKGEIISNSTLYYIPQHFGQYNDFTIAKALGIEERIKALHQILEGDASEHNFEILGDEWDIEEKALSALGTWSLEHLNLMDSMSALSGGEKTKVFLAGISLHSPDFVIMDEPSNHLDKKGREALYQFIKTTSTGLLVVSHDRVLLNLLDFTLELTKKGINAYGGNYEFYKEQYNEQLNALSAQLEEKEKQLRKAKQKAREVIERKQKLDVRGEKLGIKKGLPRILLNAKESKAQNSTSQLKEAHTNKIKNIAEEIKSIREETPDLKKLKFTLGKSELYLGKMLITFENVNFGYSSKMLWQNPLNFQIKSGDRIVISGNNGTGKTTILKLILGDLSPTTGTIKKADFKSLYVDQEYSLISQNHLTVYEQVRSFNTRNFEESELKMLLHHFLFMPDMWDKTCDKLSGGEKMKLLFCCMIVNDNNPDILILDEPTNNLDIDSLQVMSSILKEYKGTIIIISHDTYFKEEIGVTQTVDL